MKKLKIQLTEKVENIIKNVDEELKGEKEFSAFLIADKTNVWKITDLWFPEQEVSGATVDIPAIDGKSQYEQKFVEYYNAKNDKVIVGTMHSHNSMGAFHSSTDDDDVDNNSYLNLNAGLPFIDIVWSHNAIEGWVVIKVNNGIGKQVFTVNGDNLEIETVEQEEVTTKFIEDLKDKYKDFDFNEELLKRAFKIKTDVSEYMKNIKEKKYTAVNWKTWQKQTYGKPYKEKLVFEDNFTPKMRAEWHKKKGELMIRVWNDNLGIFGQEVELWVEDAKEYETQVIKAETGNNSYVIWLKCPNKKVCKKMREELEEMFEEFKFNLDALEMENDKMGLGSYNGRNHEEHCEQYDVYRDYIY